MVVSRWAVANYLECLYLACTFTWAVVLAVIWVGGDVGLPCACLPAAAPLWLLFIWLTMMTGWWPMDGHQSIHQVDTAVASGLREPRSCCWCGESTLAVLVLAALLLLLGR